MIQKFIRVREVCRKACESPMVGARRVNMAGHSSDHPLNDRPRLPASIPHQTTNSFYIRITSHRPVYIIIITGLLLG